MTALPPTSDRSSTSGRWDFWIDRGGTFTDVVARDPGGAIHVAKLLSEDPERYDDAAVAAIRRLTGVATGALPPLGLRIGTTVATNALLQRAGEPTVLAITRGFGDALAIGYQDRPELFARTIRRPPPLYARVVEIGERVAADGAVLVPLDEGAAHRALEEAFAAGLRAIAIVLIHGWQHRDHEIALARIAAEIGFTQISVSHQVAPLIRLIGRGDTTLVDAYLSPVLRHYVDTLRGALGSGAETAFMQSNGGLVSADFFRGKDAILSGPAGGIVGMAESAGAAGFDKVVGFDMGGTSTDVSWFAGTYERDEETIVAGVRLRTPMLRIHTVAAGGGSICRFEDGRFVVGPQSAGAVPGPASYRRGGPLTVTDCNVLLGKIQPGFFPHLFGDDGDAPLDRAAVEAGFARLVEDAGGTIDPLAAAEGCIAIAVANMANAIKAVSVQRGHDVSRAALACFGGAGGQHACLVADALGIDTILIHPLAGVLSAYGMGLADRRVVRERTIGAPLDAAGAARMDSELVQLVREARDALEAQSPDAGATIRCERRVRIRPAAGDASLVVEPGGAAAMRSAFDDAHLVRFGYVAAGDLVIDAITAEAIAVTPAPALATAPVAAADSEPRATVATRMAGETRPTPVYDRSSLTSRQKVAGPALVLDPGATTVVEPGWGASVDAAGNLIIRRVAPRQHTTLAADTFDPVRLEIFNGLFTAIAEDMGTALRLAARSVNIRERLDFSCALFDAAGNLVANAPHIPVHLGSMGESIRTVLIRCGAGTGGRGLRPGDVYAINAPYAGGTHLPDITVVMPVFIGGEPTPRFFVAARGHHADVGGITPGSMPPTSRHIDEEGVLFDTVLILEGGVFRETEVRRVLGSGAHPARNPDQNIADLQAQVAACTRGAAELARLCEDYGAAVISGYMEHIQVYAERVVRRLVRSLTPGRFVYEMDNGAIIRVGVEVDHQTGALAVDFAGTSDQRPDNFNAPRAITRAAVLYVVRCLVDEPIPLNDGCLRAVTIDVPEGSMLDPRWPAAVVAGNVETSQAVTDALFGALGVLAASQGTMNNLTFGDATHQYYETIAGGAGASPDGGGASAVQTHMTNSRLTDPEVLETRFPVLLEEFSIRRGSGGDGQHHGGGGARRRLRFLSPMSANILSNHRRVPPFGLAGGGVGAVGSNRCLRADGSVEVLGSVATVAVQPGDAIEIDTPGGGGFGPA